MARRQIRLMPIPVTVVLALGTLASGSVLAAAGDPPSKPTRRILPAAKPANATALRPAIGLTSPLAPVLPPLLSSGGGFNAGSLASGGLASGGLRSTLPPVGDPAAQCRTTCGHVQITCIAQDDSPECGLKWAQCTAGCDR